VFCAFASTMERASAAAARSAAPPASIELLPAVTPSFGETRRIGRDHADPFQRDVEFLGDDLRQRRNISLAQLDAPAIDRDGSERIDPQPGIEARLAASVPGSRGPAWPKVSDGAMLNATTMPPATRANSRRLRFFALMPPISFAARTIARTMRLWLPQRHKFPARPSRICASVGRGFLSKSAFAVKIMH